jgi:hypothetical protein
MPTNKNAFTRAVTPTQGLALVAILAAVAALVWAVSGIRARARAVEDLRSSIPKLCQEVSLQRALLVSAIEAYKNGLGFYPPDHLLSRTPPRVDPVTNQLMYELLGTLHDPVKDMFTPPHAPAIRRALIKRLFNAEGFRNSAEKPQMVRHFLDGSKLTSSKAINEKPEEVGLASYWPNWEGIQPDLYAQISPGTWCYNSSCPTHNPGTYDLWIEVRTPLTNILMGNW